MRTALANAVCQLQARERDGCSAKGLQGQHRDTTLLDRPTVLFDDVVEVASTTYEDRPA